MRDLTREYPQMTFRRQWDVTPDMKFLLGQCEAFVKAIKHTPLLPEDYRRLLQVSMIKGAQATTAIEGNTLSEEEVKQVASGSKLPPSKGYLEQEVRNIIDAFNELLKEVVYDDRVQLIDRELLLRFHRLVGKDLGEHFAAIPGRFRENQVVVGTYRCPAPGHVEDLVSNLCTWMRQEFHFGQSEQQFWEVVLQAIVAHVYVEWIHPFGDGHGRTGRLVEFYIMLRGGNPNIASHILSNHYNQTRTEYYRQLQVAGTERSLTKFIEYALLGLRDGLEQTLGTIQKSQFDITWQKMVYDEFDKVKEWQDPMFKRRRRLALDFPKDRTLKLEEIPHINTTLAMLYAKMSPRTIQRDLSELVIMELVAKDGDGYRARVERLRMYVPHSKRRQ
ncbi:MAG: Fic family protein [Flavobacteriales bacterium]|nr:Fic family protein [Flavobacteriales bacterium]MBK7942829.1 Fic family protein [Flavobacteriales bacterium]MBK9698769.1 Fic family protein [Flavobacteriales bacterium]